MPDSFTWTAGRLLEEVWDTLGIWTEYNPITAKGRFDHRDYGLSDEAYNTTFFYDRVGLFPHHDSVVWLAYGHEKDNDGMLKQEGENLYKAFIIPFEAIEYSSLAEIGLAVEERMIRRKHEDAILIAMDDGTFEVGKNYPFRGALLRMLELMPEGTRTAGKKGMMYSHEAAMYIAKCLMDLLFRVDDTICEESEYDISDSLTPEEVVGMRQQLQIK